MDLWNLYLTFLDFDVIEYDYEYLHCMLDREEEILTTPISSINWQMQQQNVVHTHKKKLVLKNFRTMFFKWGVVVGIQIVDQSPPRNYAIVHCNFW